MVPAVEVGNVRRVRGRWDTQHNDNHTQKHRFHTQRAQQKIRADRKNDKLDGVHHIELSVCKDLPQRHQGKRASRDEHDQRRGRLADKRAHGGDEIRHLQACEINGVGRQGGDQAVIFENAPAQVEFPVPAHQMHAVAPHQKLRTQNDDRHIERRVHAEQRLHDGVADVADVAVAEQKAHEPPVRVRHAQEPYHHAAQTHAAKKQRKADGREHQDLLV